MPSRKQRRRRQKELRHDYEFVYLDGEGQELESAPDDERAVATHKREDKGASTKKARAGARGGGGRARRIPQPPSWTRAGKRALIFFPLFYLAFSLVSRKTPIGSRLLGAAGYSLLFIPLTYMIDRTSYRTWIRRGGDPAAGTGAQKKRRF